MIKIQVVDTVIDNPVGRVYEISEIGKRIGQIPGWVSLFDPDYFRFGDALDRCSGLEADTQDIEVEESNGVSVFTNNDIFPRLESTKPIPVDQFTIFAVCKPVSKSASSFYAIATSLKNEIPPTGFSYLFFGFSNDRQSLAMGLRGNTSEFSKTTARSRIWYDSPKNFSDELTYVMCTFSTSRGLALYVNGELVAEEPDDKRPLTSDAAEEYRFLSGMHGDTGLVGMLGVDLSSPVNSHHKKALDSYVLDRYAITV